MSGTPPVPDNSCLFMVLFMHNTQIDQLKAIDKS